MRGVIATKSPTHTSVGTRGSGSARAAGSPTCVGGRRVVMSPSPAPARPHGTAVPPGRSPVARGGYSRHSSVQIVHTSHPKPMPPPKILTSPVPKSVKAKVGVPAPLACPLSPMSPHSPEAVRERNARKLRAAAAMLPAPPSPVTASEPGKTDWTALETFSFGDPPSPTSRLSASEATPPLGTPVKTPSVTDTPEVEMSRFQRLAEGLERVVRCGGHRTGADVLPHVSISEALRQAVRRVNGFTDSGAARRAKHAYRPVFAAFYRFVSAAFLDKATGASVRPSALVDLLGCIFDMLLAPEYSAPWVSIAELHSLKARIFSSCDPQSAFAALVLMLRQQCVQGDIDETAVRLCINELLPVATAAASAYKSEPHGILKELYRFTDGHESHWAAASRRYSVSDDPLHPQPSPLGAVGAVAKLIVGVVGYEGVLASFSLMGMREGARLRKIFEDAAGVAAPLSYRPLGFPDPVPPPEVYAPA